tara:strand:- start:321 stop:1148 length:828 start_codon:yes stop_codon:yes gene_type:complete
MALGTFLAGTLAQNAYNNPRGMMSDPIGAVTKDIADNPVSTAGSLAGSLMTPGFGIIATGIGRGIDSYNQSNRADEGLQATGIQATGPMGQDWTTSAVRDFIPSFLGGEDAEDQAKDIEEEVAGLRRNWYELAADDAEAGGGVRPPLSIMVNNSDYGSYTDPTRPDQAFSSPLQGSGRRSSNTAAGQFYNRDTKQFVDAYTGADTGSDWDGNPVIGPQSVVPVTSTPLAPPGIDGDAGLWYDEGGGGMGGGDGMGGAYGGDETFDAGVDTAGDWY